MTSTADAKTYHRLAEDRVFEAQPLNDMTLPVRSRGYACQNPNCEFRDIVRVVEPVFVDERTGVIFWAAPSCVCSPECEMPRFDPEPGRLYAGVVVEPCS